MAETKKIELSENVTLSFLGNETINEVKLYKYEAKIKNIEKTKTIYLEKEASKYDKTILSDYIVKMVEEHDDQDAFFIVSNNSDDDNKDETDSSNNKNNDSKTEENSNAGGGSGGGSESYGGAGGKTYSDDTVELFQDVAKNAGEFDGSNLDAYKFDLTEFIAFKPSVDKLKFISLGELPSAKSSLGQAAVKASEGGCDEAVGMIEDLKAEIESKQIEDAMDAQVQFYQEVDEIQLQQMQRDAQLNFEDDAVTFDPTQYIVSEQEYKDGMRNTLYGTYDSLADFMNAIQSYNYQVLSSTGRMSFAKDSAGLEFFTMTDAEKDALANGEEGTIDFDAGMLAKLGLNSTSELLGIVGGFKSANDLDDFLNSIGDNDAKLAVNEYVNKLIDSRWFSEFSSTEEGKQAYYEYFVNSAKENPNRTARYDEYDAVINTEYINNCIMSGQENLIISELASRPLILRIINDETGIFGNNISYYADIEDEELIASYEKYAKENDGNYPDGIKKVNGSLKQKTYTLIGEQFLYEMDYHADEWKANYNPEKKKYTAFSKQAKYDAEVRSNKGEFVQNYENSGLTGDAERDWAILNGQIEDRARLEELKENGCLSFEDNNRILEIIGDSENQDLLDKINEVGINGLDEKDRNTLDTLLKNAGFNENQLLNFKLKYASDDNNNITNYIETQNKSLFDKVSEVGYYKLDKEERETIDQMLKEAGFSDYEITNFKTNSNTSLSDKVYQTLGSSALTTGIAFAKGVATFVENCIDAGITISNNNFWLLYGDALKGENDGAIKETKKYKEMQQELYDEVMSAYKESGAYDRDYEAFINSNSFDKDIIDYLVTNGYERDTLRLKQAKIDDLEEMKKYNPDGSASYNEQIEYVKSEIENLYQKAFLDAKIKELNLGDANASSQMSAAFRYGVRTGDFSKLYEYEKDQQMVDMANNQYSAMLDVAVDNVGNWVQGNIYDKEWYQQVEDASLIKKDNFVGVCVDQIGNMAIPIGLSMIIPGIGGALGASSASSTAALGALAKAVSSTALWTSAFGGASEEAFSQGANYGDATKYALLSATTELATEWMFSGIMGFGTGWYDDVLKAAYNKTLGNITSKVIKNPKTRAIIEKLIISGIGEGTEEVVTDLITPLWRSWTLEKENSYLDILHRDVSAESLFETFSIAFVTSLFFSGMSINGQGRNLNKNIENLSRITESNPAFNEALRNMSSDLFAQIIENDGRLSQREIFNEVIGRFREQIMADPQLREAMDQANAELLKDVIKTDANNNITNMQEVIERLFNDNLLENATAEDISTIENVLTRLTKSNTNITAEQIYQELLNSDSKLIAENFAKASQLNETTKNFIKSFTENSFSYEFKDGSKIDLSQSLLSEIAELDQTLHTNSFEINNGELVVKNESKFRKLIEHAAKDRISNLKYQNNLFRKKLGLLNGIDADTIENALYFMDQDSTIAHYTNDNVILEYDGKSINVPVNLAVQIANEIRLDNYIKDGKLVFKSEKEMKAFVNKTCELGAKAIENINKRIDTTPNKTLDDALNINNNRINMEADKNALIINRVVLEDGIVAYDVIMENKVSESDVINENDTGIRRKIIYTTEENLKNVFNEKGLAQDVIDLMNQNEDAPNIYLELTNEQVENIEKRIKNEQEKAKEKSNAIEETGTQENTNEKMIQERAETREQQTNENEVVDNKDTNVRENIVERNDTSATEATRVKVRPRENASANVNENANAGENIVERNDSSASEATRVKVRPREKASTNVNENANAGENIVERNDSSTSEATRVKVRPRENASTNVNEAAKASERVDAAQRNNATQTNADVIRNTASAATVVINAVTNNANKASIVVDAPVYGNNTSNRETQGVQNNQKSQTKQNTDNIQNDTANDIKNGFDAIGNGVREAGRRRVMELVQKNGYVAYRNEDAARLFEQNPEYKDWRHEVVDGEHRFYPPESNQNSEVIHTIDEGTIRNTQTVLETNSEIEVIKPENVEQKVNQKFKRGFDPSLSYEGFDYVVKPKASFEQALNEVIANNNGSNIVIEINNTTELTLDLIEQIPDNVKVRVTGDYNVDFMNTFKSAQQSGNGTLRNVTYTKEQLKSIMTEIYEFEKGIDPNWSDMEKARYAYDYLKNSIEYHDVKQIHELSSREGMAGNNADRLARYDGLVNLIEKSSTCQGFAATYQELLTRMGIKSRIVSGNLNGEGQHVYNVVKIDGKTFIVDSVREMLEANSPGKYPGSGFNVENIFEYHAKSSYQELIKESVLTQISENIDEIVKKGVYNGMSLEELSDFIKDNYSETQIPNNLKEFIHQIDEIKMDKAANEVEVEDIHIDEYVDGINEEQESAVEVLTKAKEDLRKLRGGAAGIVSKFLKANAVALTTIANPGLGIGSTITYNMVAEQILNGEFVANNRATEIMKETTLKILTWGYGKEQKTQIRNQIKYIEQVRTELLEQGIDLKVSRSKKIQNIISEKVKVVKENIKNVYGNVKAKFNNNIKTNGTSISSEIVNNRDSRINELIDMSRNGTDIHYEYRTSNDTSLKEVQNNIVSMYENNSKAIVLDSGSWTHIHIGANPNITLDNAIKIYVPIDGTNADVVTKQVLDFLLENNIASRNKVGSHVKGDAFVLRIFDKTDAKRVINFINEQVKLNPITGKEMPLTFKTGNVSVAMDGLTSYNQIATILIDNFAKNNLGTDITGFKEFVHALNEQIINGDVDLFETMFKDQIRNLEENPYVDNEQLAKANIYEVIDIIDKALNNNMSANEFVDYISEYQNTGKVNDVIKRITGTEVINENSNDQNRVVKPNIVKTFITNVNEKFRVVRNNIGEKFRIAKENVNQFKVDLKEKLEIRRAENSHISADTSNVRIERIKLQMNSLMETYNGKVDFIRESVIKTLEYKNIPVTEENIRTNLEQVLNGNYNVITSREGLRQQVINASNEIKYCTNELSRLSLEISANESGSIIMNASDLRLDNIIKNANEIGSRLYSEYVEMHFEDMFEDIWRDVEGYFEQNSYDNLVVERWLDGSFLNFTIGQQKHSAFGNAVKMYIPINHANASYMVKTIIEQLAKNNIASDNKISRIARSDAFVLRIYDVNDAYRVANWINNNFNLEATGSELPLCYKFGKIGIAMDGRTSYNSIVTQLIRFYSQNYTQNLDVNGFKDFVRNLKENVILNKNTDILETVFNNYFVDLKERYRMEYGYDTNYAKANAYANLYEIIDIVDANLNGNMSPIDFFRYLNEYTKPAKVGNIITNLSSSQINEDATVNQTSSESVVINNNQTTITIEEAARLIANSNENLLAAIRYQEMGGHQLHDILVQALGMKQEGKLTVSNEMQFLLDEFVANNGVITNEIIEGVKEALLYTQNQATNNFGLEIGSILENMGYERVMEKFGISEEAILNDLSQLYNDLFKTYEKFGLTEEQLNMIFAKIKFRNLDEMRRIYHKSDVDVIGGVNIAGTSYVNLDSKMNTKYEIFLENVYHECTHAIGRIVQREINGYQIDGIINEYFTDLQAKKAGGFLESEAYIPRLVNILEEIERIIDPSRELFTQVYVEGNFSSLVDRLTELTGDENLANKLAREIVEIIETTHKNMRNATENKQFLMKNYYAQQAEAFVDYLKLQLNNNTNQVNTNNSQNINESVNQENNNNVEEIEMIDESTIENRGVLEANDVVDVIKVEPNDNNSNNNNDTGNNSSNNMNKMENDNTVEERISSREDLNANQGEAANNVFDRATNNLISEYESVKARYKEILKQYDTTMDANERYDLEDEIGIFSNLKLRLAKEIVDTLNISDLFKINNNDLLNDYIDYIGLFYSNESKYNDFIKSIYDIYQSYKANNDLNSFINKIGEIRKVQIASTAFNISENYIDMCRDLIMNGPKIDIQNMENYTSQEITIYLTFRKSIILECGKFLGQLISENEYTEILDSIDIVSEYAKSKGINIGNELDTDIIRNAMKVKEGNYGVVARNIEIYEGNIVGANQGAVRKALRSGNPKLIKPLIEQVRKNHPNLTTMDAIKFLKIIEYSRSDLGVCNYAIFVNAILEANHIDIAMLEEKLGYKLIENGKLNDARLLADIFTNLNPNFIGEKGMFNHKMAKNNEGYINLSTAYNSNLNSTDDGLNIEAMNKFFREKNIPVVAKSENLIEGLRKNKLLPEQERNYIINRVAEALKNGDCPCLSVYAGTQLYDASNNEIIKLDDAHIVTIFGINENGDLRVDSWGKEYIIKTSDLVNSSVIRLNSLRLEQVDSIDNVDNTERQVKTERIDNIEKNKEIRMPYARAYENVKIFDRLKDKIKFVKENKFKNAKVIVSSKQQFYGETKETLNKSIYYYEKLFDDLKIGKKSLFEKVDNAINRDLNTMKNYVSRSEVSNTEAKFLTEKTFLRLAEKYWGNEDAMKILSDIVPSEGDTLRETIASIGDRVCEYELSMYEENASINEIHDVLDIPVKIIGNSSPILYLRLNEFEKAISRMPDNLKNILKTVDIKIYDTECFENASSSIGYFDTPKKRFAIYAGTIGNELRFYEHGASSLTGIPSIEYETITHELGHIIDNRLGNSEKGYTEISDEWQKAMEADKLLTSKNSVSDYGETTIGEDFAESIKFYYRSAGFLKKNFPNRARLVEECINNINMHSPTINAKTQNFYRSDTTLNTKAVKNLLSSKNIELSDIANLDSTKPISKIKDELFTSIKSLEIPVDSKVIDRLTYLLDTYKTSNGSIYYKDVIGNDTYIITDNNVLFRVDNNEKSILDIVDYLSNMSNSERNNMFLSFYKDTARIVNSYDTDNINKINRVLSRLFSSDTYYEHKTKYIDLYRDTNYGAKQDIISYYLKDSSLKERLVKLVKSIYPGMDDINANRLLRHMEVTPTTDEGMCSYSVIANMIYEKYYGNSEAFLNDFGYEMSINSKLNSGELMTDMYAYCNKGVLVNDDIVSKTNEGQVSLSDRKVSSMWNKLFNTDLINSFFKSKNINLEVSEEVLFDYYNIDGNTSSLSKNLFDGIISNIVKSLEQGKHVAIALSDFDIIVDGFEERINNNHVMSIVSVLDNGLLEVDSWGKKCYIDLKNVTKSASQITISELSLNEK